MSENTERETRPAGRSIRVLAFGDDVAVVEMAALDEARAFFGPAFRLEIVPDYKVFAVAPGSALAAAGGGGKFQADVTVRVIEP